MANNFDAYVPQLWANESLMILEDTLVMSSLVHRDFENEIAEYGETVNTRRPASFTAVRKTDTDSVTVQDATATNVAVKLDQWAHTSFIIPDGARSKSFKNLVDEFLKPAVIAMAKFFEQAVQGQSAQFMANMVPGLGTMSTSNVKDRVLKAREKLNINKAPDMGRQFVWSPSSETIALGTDIMTTAEKLGDGGQALREAALGRRLGFNHYMSQLTSSVSSTNVDTSVNGAINNVAGYPIGTTSITVDGFSAAIGNNSFVTINGDLHRVVSTTGGSTPTVIVLKNGLRAAVANDDVVKVYTPGQVNLGAGYAVGWAKPIVYDTFTKDPGVGQYVSFGTSSTGAVYTILQVDTSGKTILLDRPLEAAIADDAKINVSPAGDYNFAFLREAIALVCRPLALPPSDMGARSAVVNSRGMSMRVTMTYNGTSQGILVTLDSLFGVKTLDESLGVIVCG